ncbi:hypothetical protein ACLOJK_027778 [Asimina triloba]
MKWGSCNGWICMKLGFLIKQIILNAMGGVDFMSTSRWAQMMRFPPNEMGKPDALLKSNEVFEAFKKEMEKMAKSMKELKKENLFLKGKCEKTDVSLIELVEEREILKKQLEKVKNKKEKLESLCRSLQAERKQNPSGSGPDVLTNPVRAGSGEEES